MLSCQQAAVMNELEKTSAEVMRAQAEKEQLFSKIKEMEEQLVSCSFYCFFLLAVVIVVYCDLLVDWWN